MFAAVVGKDVAPKEIPQEERQHRPYLAWRGLFLGRLFVPVGRIAVHMLAVARHASRRQVPAKMDRQQAKPKAGTRRYKSRRNRRPTQKMAGDNEPGARKCCDGVEIMLKYGRGPHNE